MGYPDQHRRYRSKQLRSFDSWIFLVDEINCGQYKILLEASLKTNIGISAALGLLSILSSVVLWKSGNLSGLIHNLFTKLCSIEILDDKDIGCPEAENKI